MTAAHNYRPFSSPRTIRVLDLQPSPNFNAPLRCNFLRETSLDNLTPYHALSYVWGSTVGRVELVCEGKTILVTANCEQALRSLRRSKTVFTLWVDAVCIDQSSVSERSQQVQLMGDIYRKAKEVIVWLGRGHKKLEESFHTLKVASPIFADSVWGGMNRLSRLRYAALLRRSYHWDSETCSIICNNSWFRRIWTAQEQLLARNLSVAYGTEVISWDVFVCLITCLEPLESGKTLSEEILDVDKQISIDLPLNPEEFRMASRWRFKKLQYDLSSTGRPATTEDRQYIYDTILYVYRTSQCTDSRDKVYGIYGMLLTPDEELPIIDYSKTVEIIYEETAKCIIRSFGALEILALAQWKRELPGLPSWLPDFGVTASGLDYDLKIIDGARMSRLWSASGHSRIEVNTFLGSKPGQLALKGRILTNIREVGAKWPSTLKVGVRGENGLWGIFISWLHCNVPTYPRPNDMEIVINSFALAELFLPQHRERQDLRHFLGSQLLCISERRDAADALGGREQDTFDNQYFIWGCSAAVAGKALFSTCVGLLGVCSGDMRPGDVVAIVAGHSMPIIVRAEGNYFRYIGSAYVLSLMEGGAWPKTESDVASLETIILV